MAEQRPAPEVQGGAAANDEAPSPAEIEAEIAKTREELGETVGALAEKADVKQQAKQKIEETKLSATQSANRKLAGARENPLPAAGAVGGLLLLVLLIRRRR